MRRKRVWSRLLLGCLFTAVVACKPLTEEESTFPTSEPATGIPATSIAQQAATTVASPEPRATSSPPPLPTPAPTTAIYEDWQQIGNQATGLQISAPPEWVNLAGQIDTASAANELGLTVLLLADSQRTGNSVLGGKSLSDGAYVTGLIAHLDLPPNTPQASLTNLAQNLETQRTFLNEPTPVTASTSSGGRINGAYMDLGGPPLVFPGDDTAASLRSRLYFFTGSLPGTVSQQTQAIFVMSAPAADWPEYEETFANMAATIVVHNIYADFVIRDGSVNVLGGLGERDLVNGNLEPGTRDAWTFNLRQPRYATLSLSPDNKDIDLTLTLVSPTGQTVTRIDNGYAGGTESVIDLRLVETGLYVIEIGEFFNEPGRYTLSLVLTEDPLFGGGGGIALGQTIQSDLPSAGQHVWKFNGSAGSFVSIVLTPESNFDAILDLFGPDGRRLIALDEGFSGDAEVISGFELPLTGEYDVVVRSFAGDGGSYSLSLDEGGEDTANFYDAGDLTYGDTAQESLRTNEAHAWFFNGKAGDEVTITVTPISVELDLEVWLLDPNVERLTAEDDQLAGEPERINVPLPQDGQYLILVRDFFGEAGNYEIELAAVPIATPVNAGLLEYGEAVSSTLGPGQMMVWYFEAEDGDRITAEIIPAAADQDLILLLYNPNGVQILEIDDTEVGESETLPVYQIMEDGRWGLAVREFYGEAGDYSLLVDLAQ